jgi:hypothetical protein
MADRRVTMGRVTKEIKIDNTFFERVDTDISKILI